jgi:hypothetical protein
VRTFLQLLASARRTFVGNGASKALKLAKKAFPLDRAIVIAILRPVDPAPVVAQALGFHDTTTSRVPPTPAPLEPLGHCDHRQRPGRLAKPRNT